MSQSTQLFNDLNGSRVTRAKLESILKTAKTENNIDVIYRISKVLNDFPDFKKFEINLTPIPKGLNAPRHVGSYKQALDNCGRLRKGWKFENGSVVKVEKPKAKAQPKPKAQPKKSEKNDLKNKILQLKDKYNFDLKDNFPVITKGLNGCYLADGHEIITEDVADLFNDDIYTGLNASAKDVEAIVNSLILEKIKTGEKLPAWKQSWATKSSILAQNFETKKEYTGSNAMILNVLLGSIMPTPYYLTASQIEKMKGSIKKGAKSVPLVYYNFIYTLKDLSKNPEAEANLLSKINGFRIERKNKKTIVLSKDNYAGQLLSEKEVSLLGLDRNEYLTKGFLRYYRVFNIADTTGIDYEVPSATPKTEVERIKIAEDIINGYVDSPKIVLNKDEAVYNILKDEIGIPNIEQFSPKEEYYSTLFHEIIHSTMHESRLNRLEHYKGKDKNAQYAFEELIAELGASYLCGLAGILEVTHLNSSSYLKGWHEKLQKYTEQYSDFFIYATKEAQKAVDYVLKGYNASSESNEDSEDKSKEKARAKAKALKLKLKLKLRTKNL